MSAAPTLPLRIVSFNIGLRGLEKTLALFPGGLAGLIDATGADLLALQETKHTPRTSREIALAPGFSTFISGTRDGSAYAGVLIAVRNAALPVIAVQEGLTGVLSAAGSRGGSGSSSARSVLDVTYGAPHGDDWPPVAATTVCATIDDLALDSEGRALIVDLGIFVLMNIYAPSLSSENPERASFKAAFHALLAASSRALALAGRRVILVGDLNVCHAPLDTCEPTELTPEAPMCRWLSSLLGGNGQLPAQLKSTHAATLRPPCTSGCMRECAHFSDSFRRFHPYREGAFTCWNERTGAFLL